MSHLVAHNGLLTASVSMSTGWIVQFKWTLKQADGFKVKFKKKWITTDPVLLYVSFSVHYLLSGNRMLSGTREYLLMCQVLHAGTLEDVLPLGMRGCKHLSSLF